MAEERKSPLDQLLDLFVYAPLGVAMTVSDELPKLIDKGRTRSTNQISVARMIGQFAVTQGQQEATKRLTKLVEQAASAGQRITGTPTRVPPPPATPTGGAAATAHLGDTVPMEESTTNGNGHANGTNGSQTSQTSHTGPEAELLAIPGYDSLSASQVVQRLAGLSSGELDAVKTYEEAHRGRRTILSKVAQLQDGRV